jgi:hypothetical protein
MYANTKSQAISSFLRGNDDVTYSQQRLTTQETDSGSVELIAYGWIKLAEYHPSNGTLTLFTGHTAIGSQTVSRYLNDVAEIAKENGKRVILSGESPVEGQPNDGVKYIGDYVSMDGKRSPVERMAVNHVIESIDA